MNFTNEELENIVYKTSEWELNDEWVETKNADSDEVAYVFSKTAGVAPFYKFTVNVPLQPGDTSFEPSEVVEVVPVRAEKFEWVEV